MLIIKVDRQSIADDRFIFITSLPDGGQEVLAEHLKLAMLTVEAKFVLQKFHWIFLKAW